jgi:phosphatidate phosphatase APP1
MPRWKSALHQAVHEVESSVDRLRYGLKERLKLYDSVQIVSYRGYGTRQRLHLKGRVLEGAGRPDGRVSASIWTNLLDMYRRFETDEVPGVAIRAACPGDAQSTRTDEEGYFEIFLHPSPDVRPYEPWREILLELLDDPGSSRKPEPVTGHVLVPPVDSHFGIISDVDDTVIHTNATSLLSMVRTTLLNNAQTRLPFKGVAAFYRALQSGPEGDAHNPFFYVSSSPWNLYDLLVDFFDLQGIPAGPFLLRDLGIDAGKFIKAGHHEHKLKQIRQVLSTYPHLHFILIGDSGQEDPEIYQKVISEFPERILTIYIRDVSPAARDAEVQEIAEKMAAAGVEVVLAEDSVVAAQHAAAEGFIRAEALPDVAAEKVKDQRAQEGLD